MSPISYFLMFCRFDQKRKDAYDGKREISPYNALPGTLYTNNDNNKIFLAQGQRVLTYVHNFVFISNFPTSIAQRFTRWTCFLKRKFFHIWGSMPCLFSPRCDVVVLLETVNKNAFLWCFPQGKPCCCWISEEVCKKKKRPWPKISLHVKPCG